MPVMGLTRGGVVGFRLDRFATEAEQLTAQRFKHIEQISQQVPFRALGPLPRWIGGERYGPPSPPRSPATAGHRRRVWARPARGGCCQGRGPGVRGRATSRWRRAAETRAAPAPQAAAAPRRLRPGPADHRRSLPPGRQGWASGTPSPPAGARQTAESARSPGTAQKANGRQGKEIIVTPHPLNPKQLAPDRPGAASNRPSGGAIGAAAAGLRLRSGQGLAIALAVRREREAVEDDNSGQQHGVRQAALQLRPGPGGSIVKRCA